MPGYLLQRDPFIVPTTDGKSIAEHFGLASHQAGEFSLALMHAPAGWSEPHQTPEFDEITLLVTGKKRVEVDGTTLDLEAGQSVLVKKGSRVRYSNPFEEEAVYVSLCQPAFSPDKVHREE